MNFNPPFGAACRYGCTDLCIARVEGKPATCPCNPATKEIPQPASGQEGEVRDLIACIAEDGCSAHWKEAVAKLRQYADLLAASGAPQEAPGDAPKKQAWILTEEFNEYDQRGKYFVGWFPAKPTAAQLMRASVPHDATEHVLNGGGRRGVEDHWFNLEQLDEGNSA